MKTKTYPSTIARIVHTWKTTPTTAKHVDIVVTYKSGYVRTYKYYSDTPMTVRAIMDFRAPATVCDERAGYEYSIWNMIK